MVDTLFTYLSMENHHPSTLLSMDSSASSSHEELDLEMNRQVILTTRPPDINLPLSAERSPTPQPWNLEHCDLLEVGLGSQIYETETFPTLTKIGKKCTKRVDSIWGAWFFFSFYFRPVLNEKSKAKIIRDVNGVSGFEKSDLQHDVFMVQHDMENMYMWAFKDKPENALGKMQLRSYMNGHSRPGERTFPFSVEKGFVRSHRMQRKHYRGLSNPQCVHGIELVPSPNLMVLDDDERKRWKMLTGRDPLISIPPEASDFTSWRNLPHTEIDIAPQMKTKSQPSKTLNLSSLTSQPLIQINGDVSSSPPVNSKKRKDFSHVEEEDCYLAINQINHPPLDSSPDLDTHPTESTRLETHSHSTELTRLETRENRSTEPRWLNKFSGVMREVYGPVTASKAIYEDEEGYLILISLPFVDPQTVKVSWRNTLSHGIIKVSCVSTSLAPCIKRNGRTFKLSDPSSEHCPPGEFVREIPLSTRIPEDAKIDAYFDGSGTILELLVPKLRQGTEEHEVRVCLRPHPVGNDFMLT